MFSMCSGFSAAADKAVLDILDDLFPHLWPEVMAGNKFEGYVPSCISCSGGIVVFLENGKLNRVVFGNIYFSPIGVVAVAIGAFVQRNLLQVL